MKRILFYIVSILTLFVFQGTLFRAMDFGDTVPNLLLIFTVSIALMRGEKTGLLIGFFAGLLLDIFTGTTVGFYALIYMYLGYGTGGFSMIFYPEDVKLPIIMIIVNDFLYGFLVYVLMFLLRGRTEITYYLINVIIPEIIYTVAVTILLYPLTLWINKLLEKDEIRKAKKFVS